VGLIARQARAQRAEAGQVVARLVRLVRLQAPRQVAEVGRSLPEVRGAQEPTRLALRARLGQAETVLTTQAQVEVVQVGSRAEAMAATWPRLHLRAVVVVRVFSVAVAVVSRPLLTARARAAVVGRA